MANWKALIRNIRQQIKPILAGENFHSAEMAARKAIQQAASSGDELELRAAMGSISGLRRRWAKVLVLSITACVFEQSDTSRQKIREWQMRVFGQSISSNQLDIYGKDDRSGGGRSSYSEPSPKVNAMAQRIFGQYRDALKKL